MQTLCRDNKDQIIEQFRNTPKSAPVQWACEQIIDGDLFELLKKDETVLADFSSYWYALHDDEKEYY